MAGVPFVLAAFTTDLLSQGVINIQDDATTTTEIAVNANTDTVLTNDAQGTFTSDENAISGIGLAELWDQASNQFVFNQLNEGDVVDFRLDIDVTTTVPNQRVIAFFRGGIGGFEYDIQFDEQVFPDPGQHKINRFNEVAMFDGNTINNRGQFMVNSDDACTARVNGFLCTTKVRG